MLCGGDVLPDNKQFKEGLILEDRFEGTLYHGGESSSSCGGNVRRTGHTESAVRKQSWRNIDTQVRFYFFTFCSVLEPSLCNMLIQHTQANLLTSPQLSFSGNILEDTSRCVS